MFVKRFLYLSIVAAIGISAPVIAMNAVDTPNGKAAGPTPQAQRAVGVQTSSMATAPQPKRASSSQSGNAKTPTTLQGVNVIGILQSQMQAVQLKRAAPNIQDSITSVSIGQLPDITITNSLARVPGVEIDRSAGEGTGVNVRGLPQVTSLINGEAFLTSDNIYNDQPNYETLPSALFSGVDVIKSATASLLTSGISGTINLHTRQPWDMPFGWTVAGTVEAGRGQQAKETRPNGNVLVSYNAHGHWGASLGVSYSDYVHSFANQGFNLGTVGPINGENSSAAHTQFGFLSPDSWAGTPIPPQVVALPNGGADVNGDGKSTGAFQNFERIYDNDNIVQPKRLGINAAFETELGSDFTLTANSIYTKENNRSAMLGGNQIGVTQSSPISLPLVDRDTGAVLHNPTNQPGLQTGDWDQDYYTVQKYTEVIGDWEPQTDITQTRGHAHNSNVDLKFYNGGPFNADLRWVNASADNQENDIQVQTTSNNGDEYPNILMPGVAPLPSGVFVNPASMGGNKAFNPGGFPFHAFDAVYDWQGTNPVLTWPSGVQERLLDPSTYSIKGFEGDGSRAHASMNVVRFNGTYQFTDQFSIDFGLRNSIRTASLFTYNPGTRLYAGDGASDPAGCLVRFASVNHVMNGEGVAGGCTAGNDIGYFRANPFDVPLAQLPSILGAHMISYQDVGDAPGFVGVGLDPSAIGNPWNYYQALAAAAGGTATQIMNPAASWDVFLHTKTAYAQADFSGTIAGMPFSGNAGVRYVSTNLRTTQNDDGVSRPYGVPPALGGQVFTAKHYTDILPAINVAIDLTPKLILRMAGSKNMMPLSLDQWGGGISRGFQSEIINGHTLAVINTASTTGNPNLKPWRSTNYDVSVEYYMNSASMFSLAAFEMRIASFIEQSSVITCDLPDSDGVVRRCVPLTGPVQGEGATLHGFEGQYRQALTFLPGLLKNTGFDANVTFSPSSTDKVDMAGRPLPFPDNSKYNGNLTLWYQGPKLQVHVSGTYRTKRAVSENVGGISGLEEYQAPTTYIDASVAYQVARDVQVYLQAENLTDERQDFYLVWPDQKVTSNISERYYMLGARFHF